MSKKIQPPRGTQDLLPPFSERFADHVRRCSTIFERYGYRPIVTPMFEETSVFMRGIGEESDIVSKEMYTFEDRSGNLLTLRPEGTAPVIRAVITNRLWERWSPMKLWYSAAMFRYDRPQKGRYRQHHQVGIEAIGSEDPAIDAEVIEIGNLILKEAGLSDVSLLLNSIGHAGCRPAYLEALVRFLEKNLDRLDDDCKRRVSTNPLRVFDCKVPEDREVLASAPTITDHICDACRAHIDEVRGHLDDAGMKYAMDPRLVRGLDYYTRTTFEFQAPQLKAAQSTVCGGGRYDGLSELLGGPHLPGIGFGSGVERVLLAAEDASTSASHALECYVVPLSHDEVRLVAQVVKELRGRGISADRDLSWRSVKDHIVRAGRRDARFIAIIGPQERAQGTVTLRNLATRVQRVVPLSEIADRIEEARRSAEPGVLDDAQS